MEVRFYLKHDYGRKAAKVYYTDEFPVFWKDGNNPYNTFMWGLYFSRYNGPNTAYARFYKETRWPRYNRKQWFGFRIDMHFYGANAGQKARRWIKTMINNPPSFVQTFSGPVEDYLKKKKKKMYKNMRDSIKKYEDILKEAIFEAERFLTRAKIALDDVKEHREDAMERSYKVAAALRSSLDLSSALVTLRKAKRWQ